MIRQAKLKILLALYDRRLGDVAAECEMSIAQASLLVNCRRSATPEQLDRLEMAIVRPRRHSDIGSEDRALVA